MKILLDVNKNLQNVVLKMKKISSKNENPVQMFSLLALKRWRDVVWTKLSEILEGFCPGVQICYADELFQTVQFMNNREALSSICSSYGTRFTNLAKRAATIPSDFK